MRFTFKSDDCMVITIPLGNLRSTGHGELMPEKFTCVFKDVYKVFLKGMPKTLGTAQLTLGVFIICLGAILIYESDSQHVTYTLPSILFIVSGILTYAAGHTPIMHVVKLSFSFNIISLFWSLAALTLCVFSSSRAHKEGPAGESYIIGLKSVIGVLCMTEFTIAAILIYWESKAVCRTHFNVLPTITLKQDA